MQNMSRMIIGIAQSQSRERRGVKRIFTPALAVLLLTMQSPVAMAQQSKDKSGTTKAAEIADPFPQARTKAPSLDGGLGWLNTGGPIQLSKLKGKVVLLDFWTYCCINCMHILPDLAKLEQEFPNELVVIGVHSAKFLGEKDNKNIRDAIQRYGIRHPVVNDGEMAIWNRYSAQAWPTFMLIDPRGIIIGSASGEGNYEILRDSIKKLIDYHKSKGTLDSTPLRFELETFSAANTPLRYPGKVTVDESEKRIAIADSSHHRVIVANLQTGKLDFVIGSATMGYKDGAFDQAQFNDPQGLALDGNTLYIADRNNHAIRKADLDAKTVSTIAGTGKQGFDRVGGKSGKETSLASPWDLLLIANDLYIAMAGTHQIWKLNLTSNRLDVFAGTGRENIADGSRSEANFAQPSGLATDGESIFVADSEVSAVRKLSLKDDKVETLVGRGLFEFGDMDGPGNTARLQHALGVAFANGSVFVADTYNNKIKTVDAKTGDCKSYLGDVNQGTTISPPRFDEPGGITIRGKTIYVADTNNHRICTIDIATKAMKELKIDGLTSPKTPSVETSFPSGEITQAPNQKIDASGPLTITCTLSIPEGQKLNDKAPTVYRIDAIASTGARKMFVEKDISPGSKDLRIVVNDIPERANLKSLALAVTYYTCESGAEGLCRVETKIWNIPITVTAGGAKTISLQ